MQRLQDYVKKASLIAPVRGTAVGTETYANLANYASANIVVRANVGTSDEDAVLTLVQAKDAAGDGAKALSFSRAAKVADSATSGDAVELSGLNSSVRIGVTAGDQIWQINVVDTDLDMANDYTHVTVDIDSSMADTVFSAEADLYHARHTGGVDKLPS